MDEARLECDMKLVDSIIGGNTQITSSGRKGVRGHTIIVGDNSQIAI